MGAGYGVTFTLMVTGSANALGSVKELAIPELEKNLADSTCHGSSGSYSEWADTGWKLQSPFDVVLLYTSTGWTVTNIAYGRTSGVAFLMALPDSQGSYYSECHIQKLSKVAAKDPKDVMKIKMTVQPTGAPTVS